MFDIWAVSTNTYHGFSLEEALTGIAKSWLSLCRISLCGRLDQSL